MILQNLLKISLIFKIFSKIKALQKENEMINIRIKMAEKRIDDLEQYTK